MTTWARRCIIIPASIVTAAQNLAGALAVAGEGMFTTPCSPSGVTPATHYITEGCIDAQVAALLPNVTTGTLGDANQLYSAAQQEAALQLGYVLTATLTDAQNLIVQGYVSEEDPFTAMSKNGLQLIQPAI